MRHLTHVTPSPKEAKTMTKPSPRLSPAELQQFTGSESWYRSISPAITFTDGAKHVADEGGAYWLLDEIALAQAFVPVVKAEAFQVWHALEAHGVRVHDFPALVAELGVDLDALERFVGHPPCSPFCYRMSTAVSVRS